MTLSEPWELFNSPPSREVVHALQRLTKRHDARADSADIRGQISLWFEASRKQAHGLGIPDDEFIRWIDVDFWNIAGDSSTARAVDVYRALAGRRGPLLAAAGISPEAAIAQARESGLPSLLEGCEAVIGLSQMSELLTDLHVQTLEPAPQPQKPIDFS